MKNELVLSNRRRSEYRSSDKPGTGNSLVDTEANGNSL